MDWLWTPGSIPELISRCVSPGAGTDVRQILGCRASVVSSRAREHRGSCCGWEVSGKWFLTQGDHCAGEREGSCGKCSEPGQLSPFISFTENSLLPDSVRWLPEQRFLCETSWGEDFHLEQETAFMSHQKGPGAKAAPAEQEDALGSPGSWDMVGLSPGMPQWGCSCLLLFLALCSHSSKVSQAAFCNYTPLFFNLTEVRLGYTELQAVWPENL